MAGVNFDRGICNHCPNCGIAFTESQPDAKTDTNVIVCGDSESMTGCGFKFIIKSLGFEPRDKNEEE